MTPEKVAVLVITGVIAVLLSITLMGSPDATEKSGAADPGREAAVSQPGTRAPQSHPAPQEPRVINIGGANGGEYKTKPKVEPAKPDPLTGGDAPPPAPATYKIKQGDTLAKIGKAIFGRSSAADDIKEANPGLDPRKLKAGMEIKLPALKSSVAKKPGAAGPLTPVASAPDNSGTRELSGTGGKPAAPKATPVGGTPAGWHVVAKGEKLEGIARDRYGKASDWQKIYAANRDLLPKPESLKAGMKLRIP